MEVSGAGNSRDEEEEANSAVECGTGDHEEDRLSDGAHKSQPKPYKVEFSNLKIRRQWTSFV